MCKCLVRCLVKPFVRERPASAFVSFLSWPRRVAFRAAKGKIAANMRESQADVVARSAKFHSAPHRHPPPRAFCDGFQGARRSGHRLL